MFTAWEDFIELVDGSRGRTVNACVLLGRMKGACSTHMVDHLHGLYYSFAVTLLLCLRGLGRSVGR